MKMEALKEEEIQEKLRYLPNWKVENNTLVRMQTFPNYLDALEFVYKVGHAAETADHHPDIFLPNSFTLIEVNALISSVNVHLFK